MASKIGFLVLCILVCKIQSQAVEIDTNLHYSQFFAYPSFIQTSPTAQPATPTAVPVAPPSPPPAPVAVLPQQYLTSPVPTPPAQPCSAPIAQPAPPVAVTLPPQQYLTSPAPITLPAPQYLSAPVVQPPAAVTLPTQPNIPPTVTLPPDVSIPVPQPVFIPQPPPTVTFSAPPPTSQVSPPPPLPILPPSVQVSPPPLFAIQELPISINVPVIPSLPNVVPLPVKVPPSPIPMISTTVVDNSLANKLANVLQLLLLSQTMEANVNPYYTSPFLSDFTLYDAIGNIGTIYSPEVVTAPFYTPAYGVTDIIPSIFGAEPFGTVTELVTNVGAVSEVLSPFGDFYTYSPLTAELLLPNQMVYNLPQIIEPALEQIVYF